MTLDTLVDLSCVYAVFVLYLSQCSDLKPENLLMTSKDDDADLKIVDFGFAMEVDGFSLTQQCGTPGYIAPEILENKLHGTYNNTAHHCTLQHNTYITSASSL